MNKKKLDKLTSSYEEWLIDSLRDKKEAGIFLGVAFEEFQKDGDIEALLLAFRHVAMAQGGIKKLSQKTHLNRESLYKTLSRKGNPRLETVRTLLKGLGFKLSIEPIRKKAS